MSKRKMKNLVVDGEDYRGGVRIISIYLLSRSSSPSEPIIVSECVVCFTTFHVLGVIF
jgi:hypothetical protein